MWTPSYFAALFYPSISFPFSFGATDYNVGAGDGGVFSALQNLCLEKTHIKNAVAGMNEE